MNFPFEVVVTRSARRRKTVQGGFRGDAFHIRVPAHMTDDEVADAVTTLSRRMSRRQSTERIDLAGRSRRLADRYGLPRPAVVKWSDNMTTRWASATPATGTIRLSTRLAAFPDFVIDYVLVHELAHLVESNHGAGFWNLVEQYPLTERARGFLLAKGGQDPDGEPDGQL